MMIRRLLCLLFVFVLGGNGLGADVTPEIKRLKVFLADFNDLPHPEGYTTDFFERVFFGMDDSLTTPEGKGMGKSVKDYFLDVSQGTLVVEGEVTDWIRIDRDIAKIPHWKRGMEPFGESWPIIVAETLRGHGLTGEGAKDKLRLSNGHMPDLLVFLNTDWGVGGCNRGWPRLKEVLAIMGEDDLWDPTWLTFPSPYSSFSATIWRDAPKTHEDGTIDAMPSVAKVELFPISIMMHEMGHQLAGLPDLYGPSYAPWGVFDLMGGPAANSHYSMGFCAFLREKAGWMDYTDVARRTQEGLTLRPLRTHMEALRFPQGPRQETIVVENRRRLEYGKDYGTPPVNKGQRLLLYRVDPEGRHWSMVHGSPHKRITTMIRRPEHYGEVWGEGSFTDLTGSTSPSSHNSLGELWWKFRNMRQEADEEMVLDSVLCAVDCTDAVRRRRRSHHLPHVESEGPPRLYLEMKKDLGVCVLNLPEEIKYPYAKKLTDEWGMQWQDELAAAWLVPTAGMSLNLIGVEWKAPSQEPSEVRREGLSRLGDGWLYGVETLGFTMPGRGTRSWSTANTIPVPDEPTMLRGQVGLVDSRSEAHRVKMSFVLEGDRETWNLMKDLSLQADVPSVLEIALPAASRGKAVRMRLDLESHETGPITVSLPSLRLGR